MNCVTQLQVIEWMIVLQKRSCTSMIIGKRNRHGRPPHPSTQPNALVALASHPSISIQIHPHRPARPSQSESSQAAAPHQTHHGHRCTIQSNARGSRRLHQPNWRPARGAHASPNTQSHQPNQLGGLPALRAWADQQGTGFGARATPVSGMSRAQTRSRERHHACILSSSRRR